MRMGIEGVSPAVLGQTLFLTWGQALILGLSHERFSSLHHDLGLAEQHCVLDWGFAGARVFALGTNRQTLLNEEPVQMAALADGDLLQLGQLRFRVHLWPRQARASERVPSPLRQMLHRERAAGPLYLLVDTASAEGLAAQVRALDAPWASLYRGTAEENLEEVAPYLVDVSHHPEDAEALLIPAWGKRQVALLRPTLGFDQVRRHFRRFLFVEDPLGRKVYFRFSDPVVLQRFLLASTPEEAELFLREIEELMLESDVTPSRLLRLGHRAFSRIEPLCSA